MQGGCSLSEYTPLQLNDLNLKPLPDDFSSQPSEAQRKFVEGELNKCVIPVIEHIGMAVRDSGKADQVYRGQLWE